MWCFLQDVDRNQITALLQHLRSLVQLVKEDIELTHMMNTVILNDQQRRKQRLGTKTTIQRPEEQEPIPVDLSRSIAEEPPTAEPSSGPKSGLLKMTEIYPVRQKKDPKIKADLPLALKRIHEKLDSPVQLYKLHLKRYHMSTEQFRRRTSALKIPEDIYAKYDLIVKQCETCQKEKRGPSRSKISGMRSEIFGDLTFVDHSEIPLDNKYKLMFLIIYDGATQLMTSLPCETKPESETIDLLMDCFDLYQLSPKYIIAKRSSDTTEEASSSTGKKVKVELPTPPAAPTGTARHVNKIPSLRRNQLQFHRQLHDHHNLPDPEHQLLLHIHRGSCNFPPRPAPPKREGRESDTTDRREPLPRQRQQYQHDEEVYLPELETGVQCKSWHGWIRQCNATNSWYCPWSSWRTTSTKWNMGPFDWACWKRRINRIANFR